MIRCFIRVLLRKCQLFHRFTILMRRSDLMPIAAVGNTQKMLGISLEELQTNLMTLMQQMANRDASEQVWKCLTVQGRYNNPGG